MENFTKENIKQLRIDIDHALQQVAKKYELVSLKAGNASFRPGTAIFKLEARCSDKPDKDAVLIMQMAGFKPSIFDVDLPFKGKVYRVIEPRRHKVLMSCDDGKEYTMSIDMLKLLAKDHLT